MVLGSGAPGVPVAGALTIRRVATKEELRRVYDVLGSQFDPPSTHTDRARFDDLERRFEEDRPLMLVAERDGVVVGGALGFRNSGGVTLRVIAIEPSARGHGLGRRLLQTFEVAAMELGARGIALGASADSKGFYVRLGYHGRSSMHKELPLPGRILELRLRALNAALGDLDAGSPVPTDGDEIAALR